MLPTNSILLTSLNVYIQIKNWGDMGDKLAASFIKISPPKESRKELLSNYTLKIVSCTCISEARSQEKTNSCEVHERFVPLKNERNMGFSP